MTKAVRAALLAASLLLAGNVATASGGSPQLPNLSPLLPHDIDIAMADDRTQGLALRFAVTTRNRGEWALDVIGLPPRDATRAAAQQCVAWAIQRVCAQRHEAGEFVWHPAHGHWHFEDYGLYELRAFDDDGDPDMSPAGLVAGGQKVTFCLADTDPPETSPPANDPLGPAPMYTGLCPGVLQGISAGWSDTYTRDLPGQQIVLAGVPEGQYALVITIDPDDRIRETVESDNRSWTSVVIDYDL